MKVGASGPDIFEDDVACDVRAAMMNAQKMGLTANAATEQVLRKYQPHLQDIDDGPTVWFALALVQIDLGILQPRVRDTALQLIDAGQGLSRWEDAEPEDLGERKRVLQELKVRILSKKLI